MSLIPVSTPPSVMIFDRHLLIFTVLFGGVLIVIHYTYNLTKTRQDRIQADANLEQTKIQADVEQTKFQADVKQAKFQADVKQAKIQANVDLAATSASRAIGLRPTCRRLTSAGR